MIKKYAFCTIIIFIFLLTGCLFPQVDDLLVEKEIMEIDLEDSGLEFKDGSYSLGRAENSPEGSTYSITIVNRGGETLQFTGNPPVSLSGDDIDSFSVDDSSFKKSLPAGESTSFDLIFKQRKVGLSRVTLTIENNSYLSPYSMDLSIEGLYSNKVFSSSETGGDDKLTVLATDSEGNTYAAGYGYNLVESKENTQKDWCIKKFDPEGIELWEQSFDGNWGEDEITVMEIDGNGDIYIGGFGTDLYHGGSKKDWWIKKLEPTEGNELWQTSYNSIRNDDDYVTALTVDSYGNLYAGGNCTRAWWGNSGVDWSIRKYFSDGTFDWYRIYYSVDNLDDYLYSLKAINVGGTVYLNAAAMEVETHWDDEDEKTIVIGQIDSNAQLTNNTFYRFNLPAGSFEGFFTDSGGIMYACGHGTNPVDPGMGYTLWVARYEYSAIGAEQTLLKYPQFPEYSSNYHITCFTEDKDGNYYLGGYAYGIASSTSGADWWVKKFDTNWNFVWGTDEDDGPDEQVLSIAVDQQEDNLFIGGFGLNLVNDFTSYDWKIKKISRNSGSVR